MDLSKIVSQGVISHALVAIIAAIIGASSALFLGNDNPVEQAAEQVIKNQTGVDVDLSP
jgi:uncharacterized protein YpmB